MAHKHAKLMMEYAKDWAETDKPWLRWELNGFKDYWVTLCTHPKWDKESEYRRKPRTININGIEVPEPVREALECGDVYFLPNLYSKDMFQIHKWGGDCLDQLWLSLGIIHRTKEAAIQHAKALLSFTKIEGE